jgi:hypothetical protein
MLNLPTAQQLAQSIGTLLRREVEAKAVPLPGPGKLIAGGLYHDGTGKAIATVAVDLTLAACSGAAFSLIPAEAALECVRNKALDETLQENFAEVLNVMSRLFPSTTNDRVTLQTTYFAPTALPAQATAAPVAPIKGAHFEVDIDGYAKGLISLRLLA